MPHILRRVSLGASQLAASLLLVQGQAPAPATAGNAKASGAEWAATGKVTIPVPPELAK